MSKKKRRKPGSSSGEQEHVGLMEGWDAYLYQKKNPGALKEKILGNLEEITVLFELEEAGKRHPVFAKVKQHLINVVKGDSLIDTLDQKPVQLKELKRLVCVLDDVKKRDKAAYQLLEVVYGLALDAHYSKLFHELAVDIVRYTKLLLIGGKPPEVPRFGDPHQDYVAKEVCSFIEHVCNDYEDKIKGAVAQALDRLDKKHIPFTAGSQMSEKIYELALKAEKRGFEAGERSKEREIGNLEQKLFISRAMDSVQFEEYILNRTGRRVTNFLQQTTMVATGAIAGLALYKLFDFPYFTPQSKEMIFTGGAVAVGFGMNYLISGARNAVSTIEYHVRETESKRARKIFQNAVTGIYAVIPAAACISAISFAACNDIGSTRTAAAAAFALVGSIGASYLGKGVKAAYKRIFKRKE